MVDYIIEFEHRYNKLCKFKMELTDAVLAFKLLHTAGLNVKDKQLALTACPSVSFVDVMRMSEDAAYLTRYTGRRENRSNLQPLQTVFQGTNPLDQDGRRTRCAVCQNTYHWAKDCPNKKEYVKLTKDEGIKNVEECNITLFSNVLSATEIFMVEALGSAVMDTACTRTVCGEKWLDDYISELPQSELQKVSDKTEYKTF